MAVTSFQDLPLTDRDREWDGDAAEKRVRTWAGAEDGPNQKYRDAHIWYDADSKDNFTAYKLLVADVVDGRLKAVGAQSWRPGTSCKAPEAASTSRRRTSTV